MKRILFMAALLLITFCASAQIDTIRTEQDRIFQYINKALIPTGYLNEYGPEKQLIPNSHLLTYVNAAPL